MSNNSFDQFLNEWKQLTTEVFSKAATLQQELQKKCAEQKLSENK